MGKWKARVVIAPFSLAVSLSLWGIILLALATLAMALFSSSFGTVPDSQFGEFNSEFEGFQFPD